MAEPFRGFYSDIAKRAGKNPAKSAVARKILIACWHILKRQHPSNPPALKRAGPPTSRQAPAAFWPPDGPAWN